MGIAVMHSRPSAADAEQHTHAAEVGGTHAEPRAVRSDVSIHVAIPAFIGDTSMYMRLRRHGRICSARGCLLAAAGTSVMGPTYLARLHQRIQRTPARTLQASIEIYAGRMHTLLSKACVGRQTGMFALEWRT